MQGTGSLLYQNMVRSRGGSVDGRRQCRKQALVPALQQKLKGGSQGGKWAVCHRAREECTEAQGGWTGACAAAQEGWLPVFHTTAELLGLPRSIETSE